MCYPRSASYLYIIPTCYAKISTIAHVRRGGTRSVSQLASALSIYTARTRLKSQIVTYFNFSPGLDFSVSL